MTFDSRRAGTIDDQDSGGSLLRTSLDAARRSSPSLSSSVSIGKFSFRVIRPGVSNAPMRPAFIAIYWSRFRASP